MERVYVFFDGHTWWSVASKPFVLACFGSEERLDEQFGGSATYRNFETNERWVGVFGRRKASQFRRLMREFAGSIELVREPPPSPTRLAFWSSSDKHPKRPALEASVKR